MRGRLRLAHLALPRGATPCPRSGAEAGRTPCLRGGSQEELPNVRGQGQRLRVPGCDGTGRAQRRYPTSEVRGGGREELPQVRGQGQKPGGPHARRVVSKRSYSTSEVRGSSQECYAATAQERLRGATQVRGQGQRPRGATPPPRSGGCVGTGGHRGAIPCLRSEGAAVRRYPLSKVRSSSCSLLEQP